MRTEIRSPKSEVRKKPEIRNPKRPPTAGWLRISSFGFLSDFGFRISDFSLLVCLSLLSLNSSPAQAQSPPANLPALRLAIEDLNTTFGGRYQQGRGFIERLAELERQEAAAGQTPEFVASVAKLRRDALLANPLLDCDRLLLVKRGFPKPDAARRAMGTALGIGSLNAHTSDDQPRQGRWDDELTVLSNLRGEPKFSTLYRPENQETVIDPVLHFDASRILFAKRGTKESNWRLWEVGVDGRNLRQITPDDGEDVGHFDPCYLPDGRMIFASTAVYQGLPCEFGGQAMTCLYLMDPRTQSIRQLTFEQDSDWCPTMLPNGRVLYQRWEYTDQSHSNSRMLFHMNPDGTDQREFRGSGSWFPASFFYAKAIPGEAHQVIGVAGGHHGTPRSGRLLIFDPSQGRRDGEGIVQEIPGRGKQVEPIVRDRLVDGVWPQFLQPWPLSAKYHIVAAKLQPDALWGIYLVDVFDNLTLIEEVEGAALLWPIALQKTPPPPAVPDRVNLATDEATVFITDVYQGPGLKGVPRGSVKNLRVIEYYFSRRGFGGLYGTLGLDGPWDVKRILGTVPVEADGSAHFKVPANSPLALQPLDDKGQALQLMRSWFVGMPGEAVSCAGCHEPQNEVSLNKPSLAARREASPIKPWFGPARGFAFTREVQPVLDKYCVSCHDGSGKALPSSTAFQAADSSAGFQPAPPTALPYLKGDLPLTNWTSQLSGRWTGGGKFTESYFQLQRYVRRPGIEGDRQMFTPLEFHFSTTELGQMLERGHHGVKLDAEALERLAAWADLNAPFYGTWGEIPQFSKGDGKHSREHLDRVNARAMELRRKYVPSGPQPDYEAVPPTPKFDSTPVKASAISNLKSQISESAGWAFTSDEALRRQKQSAPSSSGGRFSVPLSEAKATTPPAGRFVRVSAGPALWLSIAEAQVFSAGKNVAQGKRATQSSTFGEAGAGRAVDGETNGLFSRDSVTHTENGDDEWWEVDLGAAFPIERIELWNRTDCAGERLAGTTVTVLDERRQLVWKTSTEATPREKYVLQQPRPAALDFVWVPAGEFATVAADSTPQRVRLEKGFWMARCEISNAELRQFNPSHDSRTEDRHGYQFGRLCYDQNQPDQPAVRVSWDEATAFCQWLSAKTGLRVTLPTEAQWEWACRAGSATEFWFGGADADYSQFANLGDKKLSEFAADTALDHYSAARPMVNPNRYDDWIPRDDRFNDGGFITEPVGRYQPNPWGLRDMHGNAAEWTQTADGERKVVRGGSWYDRPERCTASFRLSYPPWQKVFNVGFRVVCEPAPAVAQQSTNPAKE
jgi:formylglycine-generating enzyme required for sulfatase activity